MPYFLTVKDRKHAHWSFADADAWADRLNDLAQSPLRVLAVRPDAPSGSFVFGITCNGNPACIDSFLDDARIRFPDLAFGHPAIDTAAVG